MCASLRTGPETYSYTFLKVYNHQSPANSQIRAYHKADAVEKLCRLPLPGEFLAVALTARPVERCCMTRAARCHLLTSSFASSRKPAVAKTSNGIATKVLVTLHHLLPVNAETVTADRE